MKIVIVYALPDRQVLRGMEVGEGTTLAAAVELSGLLAEFPEINLGMNPMGIYGRVIAKDAVLRDGDRIEIYRPLRVEPKEARRKRQQKA